MYITWYRRVSAHQYSFEEQYYALTQGKELPVDPVSPYPRKHTAQVEHTTWPNDKAQLFLRELSNLQTTRDVLCQGNINNRYIEFAIPKRSGGLRRISKPDDHLLKAQHELVHLFADTAKILPHDAAYAYVEQRSPLRAMQRHQDSKWFLKLDIKDFFPSWSKEHILSELQQLHPLGTIWNAMDKVLEEVLDLAMLNNSLPQGSAASPYLSNICMTRFDFNMQKTFRDFEGHNFVYTRYADDILLSCKYDFTFTPVVEQVRALLPPNLQLKDEKTRYASNSGRNWNLGIMLNKDNQLTVGHARKERARAMLHNLMQDNGASITKQDAQVLQGELAYITSIEPNALTGYDQKYRVKFGCASYKDILTRKIKEQD